MKNIYLHVGMYKTGTSFIQKFCKENYWKLAKNNIYYPTTGMQHDGTHYGFYQAIAGKTICEKTLADLKDEISVCNCDQVLISIEHLINNCGNPYFAELLKSTFKPHQIKIIIYLRRQDKYLESLYNQDAKQGFSGTIENYYQEIILKKKEVCAHQFDYLFILTKLAENFGKENIIVKLFEPENTENWLLYSFFQLFGITQFNDFVMPKFKNESLKCETITFLNKLGDACSDGSNIYQKFGGWQSPAVIEFINSVNSANDFISGAKGYFSSPAYRRNICLFYSEDNRKIANEFFDKKRSDLFSEPLPDENENWEPKQLSMQTLLEISAFLHIQTNKKINELKEKINATTVMREQISFSKNLKIKFNVVKNKILGKIIIPFRLFQKYLKI